MSTAVDEHGHDSKALPELVDNIIKPGSTTVDKFVVMMVLIIIMIFVNVSDYGFYFSIHYSKKGC